MSDTQTPKSEPLAPATGSADWRSIADDLVIALERLDALYRSKQDAAAPTNRPEWLREPWQRYWHAVAVSPNVRGELPPAPDSRKPETL